MEIKSGAQSRYQIGYHMVWGVKYHKHLLNKGMKKYLVEKIKDVCKAYGYDFYCIGLATNHVHFFVGAAPKIAPARIVQVVKSITAKEMFVKYPQVKKQLWGGEFWKDGYYVGTVGEGQTEAIIMNYLEKQEDKEETKPITMKQLKLFF
jgi:putative transposase